MLDRVMDVLEQNPSSGHDPTKMMVSGMFPDAERVPTWRVSSVAYH